MHARENPTWNGRSWAVVVLLIAVFLLQILLAVSDQAQTFDEGFHLAAGYRYWQCGDFGINPEHPPLLKLVAAIPLWFSSTPPPDGACGLGPTDKGSGYSTSYRWFFGHGLNADRMIFLSRAAASVFALFLAVLCFLFAREMFGPPTALFALLLLVFEPTVLAHGALVTTDIAVTTMIFASVYAFYRYAQRPSPSRLILAGLFTGLALAVKHSGVLVLPILLVLAAFEAMRGEKPGGIGGRKRGWLYYAGVYAVIVLLAVAVLWTAYGWRFAARPAGAAMSLSLPDFMELARAQGTRSFLLNHIIPRIANWRLLPQSYLYGFVDVLNVSNPGQPPFILGKLYPHGRWFYFPVTFVVKSTLAFLALFMLALAAVPWRRMGLGRELFYLAAPPLVLVPIAMTSGLNIGYRHVLPIVPFLCVLGGATAMFLFDRSRGWRMLVIALFLWHAISSLRAFPNYIPYSNEFWGGPSKTYRNLTDANSDWGQAIKQAGSYLARQTITDCWIAYDGVGSLEYYGIPCRTLPPNGSGGSFPPTPPTATGTFLISGLTMSGIEWETPEMNPYREFLHAQPKANIGGAIFVYEGTFDLSGVAAIQHFAAADGLTASGKFEAARTEAERGIALMPETVRGRISLGDALVGLNPEEARLAYQNALDWALKRPEWYPNQIATLRADLQRLGDSGK